MSEELGEINVNVQAEGTEEAADQAQDAAGDMADMDADFDTGGPGDGDDGLREGIRGGIIGGLIATALGPLLDVLDPILKVLQAALAPLSVMLLRLATPVLRMLLRLIPHMMFWTNVMVATLNGFAELVRDILSWIPFEIGGFIKALPSAIWEFMSRLPGMIWDEMKQLPTSIWDAFDSQIGTLDVSVVEWLEDAFPGDGFPGTPSLPSPSPGGLFDRLFGGRDAMRGDGRTVNVGLSLEGGLDSFVERVETDDRIEWLL